jgi:hypothetical protein
MDRNEVAVERFDCVDPVRHHACDAHVTSEESCQKESDAYGHNRISAKISNLESHQMPKNLWKIWKNKEDT